VVGLFRKGRGRSADFVLFFCLHSGTIRTRVATNFADRFSNFRRGFHALLRLQHGDGNRPASITQTRPRTLRTRLCRAVKKAADNAACKGYLLAGPDAARMDRRRSARARSRQASERLEILVDAAIASNVCNQPGDGGKCNPAAP